jgi:hypothetical protein
LSADNIVGQRAHADKYVGVAEPQVVQAIAGRFSCLGFQGSMMEPLPNPVHNFAKR